MLLDEGMDTGPILAQCRRPAPPGTGAEALSAQLAEDGAGLLLETIQNIKAGAQKDPRPQDSSLATVNRLLAKDDGNLDFARPAAVLARLINGLEPWPGARALLNGAPVSFFGALSSDEPGEPGEARGLSPDGRLIIGAGGGCVLVSELRLAGKKRLPAREFVRGARPRLFASWPAAKGG
jgi:methionyl-tRNA formyltransferase